MKPSNIIKILAFILIIINFQPLKSQQNLSLGQISRTNNFKDTRDISYLLSGKHMYEVGFINGNYPSNDEKHIERGIWAHPFKLLNSIEYNIIENNQNWELNHVKEFNYHLYSTDFIYKNNYFDVKRTDFISENEIAMFSNININNKSSVDREIEFLCLSDIHICPSTRIANLKDTPDQIEIKDGLIRAKDQSASLIIGCNNKADSYEIKDSLVRLKYKLTIPANGKRNIKFLITGSINTDTPNASYLLYENLYGKDELLLQKKQTHYLTNIIDGVKFKCSNKDISDAFYCAKANVLMNIKDNKPYYKYPFIGAGVPVYPRLFGTDFCFSISGLLAGGFNDLALNTLRNLIEYTAEHLRAPHEISSDGIMLGWDHIQVSPQLVSACWIYYTWTHNKEFIQQVYPLCKHLINDIINVADIDKDGFIEGHGLMEESDFKGSWEELSSTAYLYPALISLSHMAKITNDKYSTKKYLKKSKKLKSKFNKDWWNSKHKIWACAIDENNEQKMYNFWSVIFPQKTNIANKKNARMAMLNIKEKWVNKKWGMVGRYWPKNDNSNEGVGLVHNNICSTTAFHNNEPELGFDLLKLTTKGVFSLEHAVLGLFPECQPHLCTNISQLWSYAPFLESIINGLMGVCPTEDQSIKINPSFPKELSFASVKDLEIKNEKLSIEWNRYNNKIKYEITYTGDSDQLNIKIPKGEHVEVHINNNNTKTLK